jgi:flavorubredoxin
MSFVVKGNVEWVGKIDWQLRRFHGQELSTHRGSSYNAYLVKEEKVALIDTVWAPFASEFVQNLRGRIDLDRIDYIIINHGEIDHSGALPELMRYLPEVPIYCTANGVKSLRGHYHQDWDFRVVKTGDRLSLGQKDLVFIQAPMLHWPDTMFSYLTGENILFSTDAFGQHYASGFMFNDLVDQEELFAEAEKYYANILTPYSRQVVQKIREVLALDLPLEVICPSHGVIWRSNPAQIIEKLLAWADDYREDQITIIYDTMWGGTRAVAERIAEGIQQADPRVNVKLFNVGLCDRNDLVTEVFKSRMIVVGSPTHNRGILTSVAAILEEVRGLGFRGKKAAAFGCYGWSGEGPGMILEHLKQAGFEVVDEVLRVLWVPGREEIEQCLQFGRGLAVTRG